MGQRKIGPAVDPVDVASLDDSLTDSFLDTVAHGMRFGAGPPLEQLALSDDEWDIHAAAVRTAIRQRQDELILLCDEPRKLTFFDVPPEVA